jgi:L-aspartate oxidase
LKGCNEPGAAAGLTKKGCWTKKTRRDSAWAQGGIAAVLDPADASNPTSSDTLHRRRRPVRPEATRFVVENGREAIEWLIARGVPFTGRFGAGLPPDARRRPRPAPHHSRGRRHRHGGAADADRTGAEHPNITVLERHIAVDLITAAKLGLPRNRCLAPMCWTSATTAS